MVSFDLVRQNWGLLYMSLTKAFTWLAWDLSVLIYIHSCLKEPGYCAPFDKSPRYAIISVFDTDILAKQLGLMKNISNNLRTKQI